MNILLLCLQLIWVYMVYYSKHAWKFIRLEWLGFRLILLKEKLYFYRALGNFLFFWENK